MLTMVSRTVRTRLRGLRVLRQLHAQLEYAAQWPRPLPAWKKFVLAFRSMSNLSRRAEIYHPRRLTLGQRVTVDDLAVLNHPVFSERASTLSIGDDTFIGRSVQLAPQAGFITIGSNCTLHPFCVLLGEGGITIGDDVRIATSTVIASGNHIFADRNVPIREQGMSARGIEIGADVWIGANCVILDGVKIGRGAVVAAGAVVTRDVAEYAVVAGVPARVIRQRT